MSHPYFAAFRIFVKQLSLPWHHHQLTNLVLLGSAFLRRRSLPVRRLARKLAGPGKEHAALDKRFRRFLGNRRLDEAAQDAALACLLQFILTRLGAVPFVPVMFDWLFVDDHAILGLQIPYRGRSLPLCFAVHSKTHSDDEVRQTKAEQLLLERLLRCWPADAPPPVLLCDRGFDKGGLLDWLLKRNVRFIVRIRGDHHLYDRNGRQLDAEFDPARGRFIPGPLHPPIGKARLFPHITYTQQHRLPVHLVVTAKRDPKTGRRMEWRLVTNLQVADLPHVPRLYGQRMSPEETHRDCKTGYAVAGFALCALGRMRADRLQRYLMIVALVACFLVLVAETERETRAWLCKKHWGLGLLTMGLEVLDAAGSKVRQLARRACASITLCPLWLPGDHS
jgi:Transposase DDE domain